MIRKNKNVCWEKKKEVLKWGYFRRKTELLIHLTVILSCFIYSMYI